MNKIYALFSISFPNTNYYTYIGRLKEGENVNDEHLSYISFFIGEAYETDAAPDKIEWFIPSTGETVKCLQFTFYKDKNQ